MIRLTIPQQVVDLDGGPDHWIGTLVIDGQAYRVQAFLPDSEWADALYAFTGAGEPMRTHTLPNGVEAYLAATPVDR